jgi:hypothetical protein
MERSNRQSSDAMVALNALVRLTCQRRRALR